MILASQSQRRIDILNRLGYKFNVIPADIDENINYKYPIFLPSILAELKALCIGENHPDELVIGADTIVLHNGNVLGKPANHSEAFEYLKLLSGQYHSVITGVCILKFSSSVKISFTEASKVKFKNLNTKIINEYISKVHTLDKAGGYAIQEYGDMIVESIVGSKDNIIGFPSEKFSEVMKLI